MDRIETMHFQATPHTPVLHTPASLPVTRRFLSEKFHFEQRPQGLRAPPAVAVALKKGFSNILGGSKPQLRGAIVGLETPCLGQRHGMKAARGKVGQAAPALATVPCLEMLMVPAYGTVLRWVHTHRDGATHLIGLSRHGTPPPRLLPLCRHRRLRCCCCWCWRDPPHSAPPAAALLCLRSSHPT